MNKEELKIEARQRFPVGSKFKDLVHGEVFTVKNHYFDSFGGNHQLYINVEKHETLPNKTARIYKDGKWAESLQQLIPGRWYKNLGVMENHIAKFDHISPDGCFISDGTYIMDGKFVKKSNVGRITNSFKNAQECSIDEIRDILPSDHIDKKGLVNMELVKEECKRRFPIGCSYVPINCLSPQKLISDKVTYSIFENSILAHQGGRHLYKDGKYAQVVTVGAPEVSHKSQIETIQAECKRRFPIGCSYVAVGSSVERILQSDEITYDIHFGAVLDSSGGCLYKDGKYAQFVRLTSPEVKKTTSVMEKIQEECKRRFPIGCKYVDALKYDDGIPGGITLRLDKFTYSIHGNQIYAHEFGGLLYDGVYAERIGATVYEDGSDDLRDGFEKEALRELTGGHGFMSLGDIRVGLPGYETKLPLSEARAGMYLKCVKEPKNPFWTFGKFYKILEVSDFGDIRIDDNESGKGAFLVNSKDCFELMPEGFIPLSCIEVGGFNSIAIGSISNVDSVKKQDPPAVLLNDKKISEVTFRRIGDRSRTTVTIPNLIEEVSFKRINKNKTKTK